MNYATIRTKVLEKMGRERVDLASELITGGAYSDNDSVAERCLPELDDLLRDVALELLELEDVPEDDGADYDEYEHVYRMVEHVAQHEHHASRLEALRSCELDVTAPFPLSSVPCLADEG